MLLESIVTTLNGDGAPHIAPMGPIVDADFTRLLLRPYCTSLTYQNLKRSREAVVHVTDDVELFARAAVGQLTEMPRLITAKAVRGAVLEDACRWYAIRVISIDDHDKRTEIVAEVVHQGRIRDFFGFNRAKHAVIEAAILATRVDFLEAQDIQDEFDRLRSPVLKTGGHQERRAFDFLQKYVRDHFERRGAAETAKR
jgi:hypothetical protein